MSRAYILERTLPDGTIRTHSPMRRRAAVSAAYFVLLDNGAAPATAARAVAAELADRPDGERVQGFGYTFRIVEVNR
jgi:hypothetical protein